jgi:hypothetical protein
MAEASVPGDLWQVTIKSTLEGQHCFNVLDFRTATPIDDFELRIIVALIQCFAAMVPEQPNTFQYTEVAWKRVAPVLGVEHITAWQGASAGTETGDALPSFVSAVVSKHTNLGGRSHRGRLFLPGVPEEAVVGSVIDADSPFWTSLLALLACIATKFINIGDPPPINKAVLGVYSRKLGGASFPFGAAGFTPLTSLSASREVGTTRSRKIGRGT